MTEIEDLIIKPLIADCRINFYSHVVNDTLLVMKPGKISQVHNALSELDKTLRYAVDMFQNEVPPFLELEYHLMELKVF